MAFTCLDLVLLSERMNYLFLYSNWLRSFAHLNSHLVFSDLHFRGSFTNRIF